MKILHTSDWHLGRNLSGYDLSQAQFDAVTQIIDAAIAMDVELFIIAGDIFDRTVPAVEEIKIFNDAMIRLRDAGIKTIVTSGNHDEGSRLTPYNNLLAEKFWVVGRTADAGKPLVLQDEHGSVVVYALPYLDPDGARHTLRHDDGTPLDRSHDGVFKVVMDRIRQDFVGHKQSDPTARAIVIGHAFVAHAGALKEEIDADRCDSQRDIAVGGLEIVNSNNFAEMSYVALGHLHGPKNVNHAIENGPLIRYSGSILRYSFSEAKHSKSFSIVDLDGTGTVTSDHVQEISIVQPRQMQDLSGSIQELLSDEHLHHAESFVRLTIVEEQVPANYYAQLANRYKFIVSHKIENPRSGEASATDLSVMSVDQIDPLDLMKEFFTQAKGHLPSDPQEEIMKSYLEKARRELGA